MNESDEETVNLNENDQNISDPKREKENEVAEVLNQIENGSLEIYRSSGISPAWKKFVKIRNTISKQRIYYAQCIECKILLSYKEHGSTSHLNRHKCKFNDETAERLPFRKIPVEKVDDVQKVLVKNVLKFCAEDLASYEAICDSTNFINFLQSFVTMGQNLGNIELKEIFPKSNAVRQKFEVLKDENQRELYSKFREAFKNGLCSVSFHIQPIFSGPTENCVLVMKVQYFEGDISALKNKVVFATPVYHDDSPEIFLTKLIKLFNNFGGHEHDLRQLPIVTDNQQIFLKALDTFARKNCVADIIIDILNEAFNISAKRETEEFLSACTGIVRILFNLDKHNLKLNQDNGTWKNKLLMVQSITDQYNDIAMILENESQVNFHFNKRRAEEFVSFLEPFIDAIDDLSAISYTTANKVLLWWTAMKDHLGTFDNYSYELKHIMINAMICFRSKFIITVDNKIDCFLDPRYKMLKMLEESERNEVATEIRTKLEEIIVEQIVPVASTSTAPEVKKKKFAVYETKKGDSRAVLPKKVSNKSKEAKKNESRFKRFETNDDEEINQHDEVVRYLKLPVMKSSQFESEFDLVRKFWKSQQKNLPKLYKLATSRLHTPATCGCVGKNSFSKQYLKDETLNELLFIRDKIEVSISPPIVSISLSISLFIKNGSKNY